MPVLPLVGSSTVAPGKSRPSFSASASSEPRKRTSSSLTYTLTKRCSDPSSAIRRALIPGCLLSRSSKSAPSVSPAPSTDFSPPVYVRRMVGTRTFTAIVSLFPQGCLYEQRRSPRQDFHRLLGHLAVHDAVRPELDLVRLAGGHQ